ncbi:MAG: hypothetical protein ACFFE8_08245 [Candidatus Heimdallarchaeota archaeon]
MITPPSVVAAVGAVKETYEVDAGTEDANFVNYIFQPFSTSIEQDCSIMTLKRRCGHA